MSLQKRKVGTLVIASLLCGSMLTGCVYSKAGGLDSQAFGSFKNSEGKDIKTYDIRTIERELISDKNMSTDKIDKYTQSLLVEVYKELKKGLSKARPNYINERLLVTKALQGSDEEMKQNVINLMKEIKNAFDCKTTLAKSKFYDTYILERLEQLQSDPYDLLTQLNPNDLSIREAMINAYNPNIKLDDKVKQDLTKYKQYAEYQARVINNALEYNTVENINKLKDSVITLKTNLAMLDLSGNTKKYTEMYDNMLIDSFRKDVDKYDALLNRLSILESKKDRDSKAIQDTKDKIKDIKGEIIYKLKSLKYEFEFDGQLHPEEDLKEQKNSELKQGAKTLEPYTLET